MTSSTIQDAINETDAQFNDDPQEVLRNNLKSQINYTGHAAGLTTEVATGLALDAKTQWMLSTGPWGWLGYGITNFGGGAAANIAAQKMRGEEDTDWGEVISSGLLGIIPFTSLRFAKHLPLEQAQLANRIAGKAGSIQRGAVGGAGMGVADRYIQSGFNEGELPSPTDVAIGAVAGGTLGSAFTSVGKIFTKYKGQSPEVINKTLTKRERSQLTLLRKKVINEQVKAYETGDKTKVNQALEELNEADWNFKKQQGSYTGFVDYKHWKKSLRDFGGNLEDHINNRDPFFTAADNLPLERQVALKKFFQTARTGYDARAATNLRIRNVVNQMEADGASVNTNTKRDLAGFINVEDVEHWSPDGMKIEKGLYTLAKELNQEFRNKKIDAKLTIDDIYQYLRLQDEGDKHITETIKILNRMKNEPKLKKLEAIVEELKRSGNFSQKTAKRWRRKIEHEKSKRTYEKGHKESLHEIFLKYSSGGDRISNTFVQIKKDQNFKNYLGEELVEKGNQNLSDIADMPVYTLVKLKGSSRNIKEDLLKTIFPREFPSESILEDYFEMSEIMYRNGMDFLEKVIKPGSADYAADMSGYSIAITDAIYEMIKAAENLDIGYELLEDVFLLKIPRTIPKSTVRYLKGIYIKTAEKTINDLNLDFNKVKPHLIKNLGTLKS